MLHSFRTVTNSAWDRLQDANVSALLFDSQEATDRIQTCLRILSHPYSVVPLLFGECVGEDLAQGDLAALVRVAPTGSSSFYGARGN